MRRHSYRRQTLLIVLAVTLLLMVVMVADAASDVFNPLEIPELAAQDLAFNVRGAEPPTSPIVIVAIDDLSINYTQLHWPWPRAYLAEIIDRLTDARARVIGIDVFLSEAGPDAGGDEALAQAFRRAGNVVLVQEIVESRSDLGVQESLVPPLPIFRDAVAGRGLTAFARDIDSSFRHIQAYDTHTGDVYFHWALHVASVYAGAPLPENPDPLGVDFQGRRVPLECVSLRCGLLRVNFRGPVQTFPTFPAVQVALGDYGVETFEGKIVLIGATTESLHDTYPTPFRENRLPTPGVEVVANAVDTLLAHDYLRHAPLGVSLLAVLAAMAIALGVDRHPRPTVGLAVTLGVMALYVVVWYLVFLQGNSFMPLIPVQLMLFLGFVGPTGMRAVAEEREKRRVRHIFERFISPAMVEQLIEQGLEGSQGKRADLTILFSDIRGFTTLSEKLSPEEVVAILNEYLEAMTDVIHKHGGTVDKYEGDAIVAFFGAPIPHTDHARRAALASLEMRTVLDQLRRKWALGEGPKSFEIGVGLNSGDVFVGLIGSYKRLNYTIIGDNANLAARLQDLTKQFAWPILISEATHERIRDEFDAEFGDAVQVKGKTVPVGVYRLLGKKGAPETERVRAMFA